MSSISKKTKIFPVQQLKLPQHQAVESQLSYWKEQLGGCLPILRLPKDHPHPFTQLNPDLSRQADRFATQTLELSQSLTTAIEARSQQEGVPLFIILLATFQTLLYRYTEQEDIIVGTTIMGNNRIATKPKNKLAIRTDLAGNPTFQELLVRVHQVTLSAYKHQDLPIEQIIAELQRGSAPSKHPLFDVMLNFVNISPTTVKLPHLKTTPIIRIAEPDAEFEIALYVQQNHSQINLQLVYQSALFSIDRMTALLDQFQFLLAQIAIDPDRPIQSYSLVTPQSAALLPNPHIPLPEPQLEPVTTLLIDWANQAPD